ncbi:MAG: shikimate dehydrogenase, partial [Pseudomonadota bacterium]
MKRAAVIGQPIAQSRSPLIHGHWIAHHGLDARYERCEVGPDNIEGFLERVRDGEFEGCNVTMPLKGLVADLVDEVLPEAQALGSINTVWRDGRRLIATSTDGAGFLAHLDQSAPQWRRIDGAIVVLGAGGAASAIVDAFQRAGRDHIRISNRTRARAEALAVERGRGVDVIDWNQRATGLGDAAVLVNTTALGM